jgi:hypothetical protein
VLAFGFIKATEGSRSMMDDEIVDDKVADVKPGMFKDHSDGFKSLMVASPLAAIFWLIILGVGYLVGRMVLS